VYREGDKVMAGSIGLAAARAPRVLFTGPHTDNPGWTRARCHDVTPIAGAFCSPSCR